MGMTLKITCNPYTKKITYEYKAGNKWEKLDSENPLLKYKGQNFSSISAEAVKSMYEQGYQKVIFEGTDNDYEELKRAVMALSKLKEKADENDFLACERSEKRFNEAAETHAAIVKELQGLLRIIENENRWLNETLKNEIEKIIENSISRDLESNPEKYSLYDKCVRSRESIIDALSLVHDEMQDKKDRLSIAKETVKTAKNDTAQNKQLIALCETALREWAEEVIFVYEFKLKIKESDLLWEKKANLGNKWLENYESKFKNDGDNSASLLERMGKTLLMQEKVKKEIEKELLKEVKDMDISLFAASKDFFNEKDEEIRTYLISSVLDDKTSKLSNEDAEKIKHAIKKFPKFEETIEEADSFDNQKIDSFLSGQMPDLSGVKYNFLAKEAKKVLKQMLAEQLVKIQSFFEDSLYVWFEKLVGRLEKALASPVVETAAKDKISLDHDMEALEKINSALAISKEKLDKLMAV